MGADQQQIGAGPFVAGFVDQHVEGQRGEVVGDRIDVRVLLLIDDLQVALARIAGFGADGALVNLRLRAVATPLSVSQAVHLARGTFHSVLHSEQCR